MFIPYVQLMLVFLAVAASSMAPAANVVTEVDGEPAHSTKYDSGLYVWRTGNGDWEVRMVAGGGYQKFTGVFETTQQFQWINRVRLESHDIATQSEPDRLDVRFRVWNTGEDGINFAIADGSGLCLRGSGSVVYLGQNAVPVTTPVDLTNSGACSGASVPPSTSRKYHPGHYIAMVRWEADDHPVMIDSIKPGVVGFHKRYYWNDLEPSFGQYDFSQIESDLALLAGQGMQLVAMIEDKTFKNKKPMPPYLDAYTLANRAGGYTAKRWAPYVVTRMKALMEKLGNRFDAHPNFEGVAIQESSLSVNKDVLTANDYTPEKYRDALTDILIGAAQGLPNSRVFWYMNFLTQNQGYIADIASAVAPYGVVMGGPDVLPDSWDLNGLTYPFYDQFQGQMPLFCSMQPDSYSHLHKDTTYPTKYWTMGELFRFARDDLHVNYLFWTRQPRPATADAYDWTDALPVIGNNPAFNQN